ncbi:MAG: hypothetical protein ACN6OP_27585 [Pseudomonadales bacterium]
MNALKFMRDLHKVCQFMSTGRGCQVASNNEIQTWITQGSVYVNSKRVGIKDEIEFPVTSLVLHPKGRRTTVW